MKCPIFTTIILFGFIISGSVSKVNNYEEIENSKVIRSPRLPRAVKKAGFLRTLFSVIYEQWVDGKNTTEYVRRMLNENIIDDSRTPLPTTSTTPSSNLNVSTTQPPFVLTRSELNRIIRRNVKGLVRLYNLELNDALQTSYRNNAEFRKNVSAEISKYL